MRIAPLSASGAIFFARRVKNAKTYAIIAATTDTRRKTHAA
jgi:hypothetical protein